MRVLLSAFEPFGGRGVNSSWELARRVPARPGVAVVRLPVVYSAAWDALRRAVYGFRPDAVVALGECTGKAFRLELTAINYRGAKAPDNHGRRLEGEVVRGGRCAYLSRLPIERLERALMKEGIPVKRSLCAGTYLCNEVFYSLLRGFPGPAGFVHVPRGAERRWPKAAESILQAL